MRKWFACFSPVKDDKGIQQKSKGSTKVALNGETLSQPLSCDPLQKQDSAYGLDGDEVRAGKNATPQEPSFEQQMISYGNLVPITHSVTESQFGKAASYKQSGAPKPSCNEERLKNLKELGLLDKEADPQIQHIMQLMCTVFNTNSALVALLGEDKVYVHDAINFKKGDFGWRMSLCAHTLSPANHQCMVVEDPQNDPRFAHLPLITHGHVKFYAGTPIVSTRGHRLGTVCFVANEKRKFDVEGSQMLINMGELITRELERDWLAAQEQKKHTSQPQEDMDGLVRAVECFNDAVMFVDTSQPKWRILHMNTAAQTKLKLYDVSVNMGEGSEPVMLWDLFQILDVVPEEQKSSPWDIHSEQRKAGQNFKQQNVRFNVRYNSKSGQSLPLFNLNFRCAATTTIDSNAACVGAPAFLPTTDSNHNYYFVTMALDHASRNSGHSIISALTGRISGSVPFEGVELGPLLGKGGYGSVFRGLRKSPQEGEPRQTVAIKVIENVSNLRMTNGVPLEASITSHAHHRNIVNTLDFSTVNAPEEGGSELSSASLHDSAHSKARTDTQVWMMLEYCDCGSLQEASEKGFFREEGLVQLPLILATAHDVASGMAFLHDRGVAHGDLTGGNVLLASDDDSVTGVVAKVADFGLARNLNVASKIETRTYGTVTHMPPELLEKGIFTKSSDVFSFGVLLWEMWHGVRAWSSLTFAQIITAVVANKKSLSFRADADPEFVELSLKCMHIDPELRPTFSEVLVSLESLQKKHDVN